MRGRKTGGRAKGTRNASTTAIAERLDELGLDVVAGLAAIAQDQRADVAIRARVLIELAGYLFPKRKAIDLNADAAFLPAAPHLVVSFLEDDRRTT